jgi:L-threo-3-deoxy-hexylosonate aldolase
VGKLTRICSEVSNPSFSSQYPRRNPDAPFLVLGGYADFIVSSTFVNGHGAITGLANVAPVRLCLISNVISNNLITVCSGEVVQTCGSC